MDAIEHVDQLQSHWWWRPGWRTGRHFYACHITVEDQPSLLRLAHAYQAALNGLDGLDLIPDRWLHLTLQGIGFVDQVAPAELESVVQAIAARAADVPAPTVTFHELVVRPEAVYLPATPAEPLRELRRAVRDVVVGVLGPERAPDAADRFDSYRPHVSVAYANRDQPAGPIVAALRDVRAGPVPVTFSRLALLKFHRDHQMYEWTARRPIPLATT